MSKGILSKGSSAQFGYAALVALLTFSVAPGAQEPAPDAAEFEAADENDDGLLSWNEIQDQHGADLEKRGWGKDFVLNTFDRNGDDRLREEEHRRLVASLEIDDPAEDARALNGDNAPDTDINQGVPDAVLSPQEEANPTVAE